MTKRFLFFLLIFASYLQAQNIDISLLKTINEHNRKAWDHTMGNVSFSAYPVVSISPFAVWTHGFLSKNKSLMQNGYKSAITIGSALLISTALKTAFNRDRPYVTYKNDIIRRDTTAGPYSFPSGHTTGAFAAATALSLSYNKWYVTVPSFAYAALVGYSRMRLGVHYPSDVLGGMVIGIGSGLLTWKIWKLIYDKKHNKPPVEAG